MNLLETVLRAHPEFLLMTASLVLAGLLGATGAAWTGHTDRSRAVANCVKSAIASLGWTHEYAASLAGMSREEFEHALAGRKPLSQHRIANLPDEFQAEFDRRRAALRGATVLEAGSVVVVLRHPEGKEQSA